VEERRDCWELGSGTYLGLGGTKGMDEKMKRSAASRVLKYLEERKGAEEASDSGHEIKSQRVQIEKGEPEICRCQGTIARGGEV